MGKTKEYYNDHHQLDREDGPAVIEYDKDGQVERETYYFNGIIHREDGPAIIEYHDNGAVKREAYFHGGKLDGGEWCPAIIEYNRDGDAISEQWFSRGQKFIPSVEQIDHYHDWRIDAGMSFVTEWDLTDSTYTNYKAAAELG